MSGSSPRLRGTLYDDLVDMIHSRFIPAPAGNTLKREFDALLDEVHPRACGEHTKRATAQFRLLGSSPRLRGTPAGNLAGVPLDGFIPAPAGNTALPSSKSYWCPVHPRACGEHPPGL